MDAGGRKLFVPKALCLLSHQPMFSAFAIFLRFAPLSSLTPSELYRNTITVSEDTEESGTLQVRKSSFNSRLRKGSTCNVVDDDLIVECPGPSSSKSPHS